jgi:hypothetical protein
MYQCSTFGGAYRLGSLQIPKGDNFKKKTSPQNPPPTHQKREQVAGVLDMKLPRPSFYHGFPVVPTKKT